MASTILSRVVVCIFIISFAAKTHQNVRKKRQILPDQPRIVTENGHLMFKAGANRNIKFQTSGGGGIFIDGVDLKYAATQVKVNKERLDSFQPSTGSGNLTSRLVAVETQLSGMRQVPQQIATVSSSLEGLRTQQQSSISGITTRITTLESQIGSGGSSGSGGGSSTPNPWSGATFATILSRVNSLRSQVRRYRSTRRQVRRLSRRVSTLNTRVDNLVNLLTTNECLSNPCHNGGTCVDMYNGYICRCPTNFKGPRCTQDVNECSEYAGTSLACQNGATCVNTNGGFRCQCATNWHGIHCTEQHDDCTGASQSELCGHGTCINVDRVQPGQPKYRCICEPGWTKSGSDPPCDVDINECQSGRHCSVNPPVQCINIPGSFVCGSCPQGFEGNGYTCADINECLTNNGGCSQSPRVDCINSYGSRTCGRCPTGYQGDGVTCTFTGTCQVNNGGCHPLATCMEGALTTSGVNCVCPNGYVGSGRGPSGCQQQSTAQACRSTPCQNGAQCVAIGNSNFRCTCQTGFTGPTCATQVDPCDNNPCQNGGTCTSNGPSYTCACTSSYTGSYCQDRQEGCGSYLIGETGSFQYPRTTGTDYPHQMSCAWVITTSADKILRVTFPRFSLETDPSCNFDFLQIHDGPSASAYMIGKYCGNSPPNGGSLNSTHNQLYLWFHSDASASSTGFAVQWTSLTPECGATLSGSDHGVISSPGYPGNYPHNRDCVWVVAVSPGNNIMFQFAYLAIEQHSNCTFDYLEIRDGELSTSRVLQRYCTTQSLQPLQTTGPYAYIHFHTDATISDRGFHLTYVALNTGRDGCGGTFTEDEGQFSSPGYPTPYDHNSQCVWIITTTEGNHIQLTFTSFDLETHSSCGFDSVQVRDGSDETSPSLGTFCGSDTPATIMSTGNVLFVKFQTDGSISGSGFQAQWTTGCGGLFTGSSGQIQSPLYPNHYPHHKLCRYLIQVDEGNRIRLNFQAFSLEGDSGDDCDYDYVTIYDGSTDTSPSLGGRYCSTNRPNVLRSTGNTMMVKFQTDGSISNTGFSATYTSEDASDTQECGGIITSNTGVINSPGFPNTYAHGVECTWFITVDPGLVIRLFFQSLNLEGNAPYCPDYVEVFDDDATPSNSRGRFCGSVYPSSLTSANSTMVVRFRTDHSIARQGFAVSYIALNVSSLCGATLTSTTGVITSPNFPNVYPHGRSCEWVIEAPRRNQVWVNITDFSLEGSSSCAYDYLVFRNGGTSNSPLIGQFCGRNFPAAPFVTHGNRLYVKFVTDSSVTSSGFRFEYDAGTSGCGGDLTGPTGGLISPNYPEPYNHASQCFWTITVSRGSSVFLVFQDFQLESHSSCYYDYVEVREGGPQGTRLGERLCGNRIPRPITSRTNRIWIKMKTDSSVSGRGFQAIYYSNCNNRHTDRTGVIESPNFPNSYPHRSNCSWVIEAPPGNKINISFAAFALEGHIYCRYDRLQFRDGNATTAPVLKTFCGQTLPEPFQSNGRMMRVNFITDHSSSHQGFRLEYIFDGCGGMLRGNRGEITSPNYPNDYPHRTECIWTITADTGKSIVLSIVDFDLESHSNCRFDVLEVYAGHDTSGPRLTQLCHPQSSPQNLTSTGHTMTLRFSTDASLSGRGFRATYTTIDGGCGGNFSIPQGTIMSKNYPNPYPHNTECEWLITVAPFHVIDLNFTDFYIEGGSCVFDYVKLYDGANTSSPLLNTLCGRSINQTAYKSSNNQMFIRMRTDASVSHRGFSASYVTGCGGTLNADNASAIQSPNYPNRYPRGRCVWIIQSAYNDRRVTLTFTHMDVRSRSGCNNAYVSVVEGRDAQDNTTNKFCGNTIPAYITSFGSALTVVFLVRSRSATGFRATYTSAESACGGDFTADTGRFTSPGYPDNYPINTECIWQIRVSPGNSILLSFPTFLLEQNGGLNDDYVEIRSPDVHGELVGRYIGQSPPSNLTALHGAWIKFRSDDQYPAQGFTGEWSTEYGGMMQANAGRLGSPQYPSNYPNNVEYSWTIAVDPDKVLRMSFTVFELEGTHSSTACPYDYVQLMDGSADTGTEIGKYCGTQNPGTIYSTTNVVTVTFRTDWSVQRRGFLMTWTAVNTDDGPIVTTLAPTVSGCGGDLVAGDTWANFTSPGNLQGYGDGLDCRWQITAQEGNSVQVNITFIDVEGHRRCPFDYITFHNGATSSNFASIGGRYCGQTRNTQLIRSTSNTMTVLFHTDGSLNNTGFRIVYMKACGGQFSTRAGQIMSPGFPNNYLANTNCTWKVSVRTGKTVLLTFNRQFNIASTGTCDNDYLLLLNGMNPTSPPLYRNDSTSNTNGRYCGTAAPQDIETSGRLLYASFIADATSSGAGFSLNFTEKSLACGGQIILTHRIRSRYISSPNFPSNYPQNVDCIWVVIAPSTERIKLDYDTLQIEQHSLCDFDNVQIRDGGTAIASPLGDPSCGNTIPSSQMSTGNMMFVRFITDSSVTKQGFNALVSIASCGGRISGTSGVIQSPDYPASYPINTDCEWTINGPTGHYIELNITAFRLQSSLNCSADSLQIRDGNSTSMSLYLRCGYGSTTTIRTSDNNAYIRFISDGSGVASGFSISFAASVEECGGALTTSTGTFTSPNYPRQYAHARRCIWRITASEGRRVTLTFEDFALERSNSNNCAWDSVAIYNGYQVGSPLLGRYCGSTTPPIIESSGNGMGVVFRTDGSVSHRGFRASYTTDREAVCGGLLTGTNGNITSGTGTYNHSMECIWRIEARTSLNASIVFRFDRMQLEYHTNCAFDKVEIREGATRRDPMVGRYCGNTTTTDTIIIPSNQAYVHFRTDTSIASEGFLLLYSVSNCGGILTNNQGVITSPNYPNDYDHNDGCAWIIRVAEGSQIRLTFTDFEFENHTSCRYDYLSIQNGGLPSSPVIGKYCGSTRPPTLVSQSNQLRLLMVTDVSESAKGFRLSYAIQSEGCGGVYHQAQGNITSPSYPASYPHNTECTWDINVPQGFRVKLTFVPPFDMEIGSPCNNDYVEIFDSYPNGTSVSLGRSCSNLTPSPKYSTATRLTVVFHSNARVNGNGFAAYYESLCGGLYTDDNGQLLSPHHPNNYANNLVCNYTITPVGQKHIYLLFNTFELEGGSSCQFDSLTTRQGNDTNGRYLAKVCGSTKPDSVIAQGSMFLQFVTDSSLTYDGFQASYRSESCGGVFTDPRGTIKSPLFPNPYHHNANCSWSITVASDRIVVLKFSTFEIEAHPSCNFDAVSIYDGPDASSSLIGKFCGSRIQIPPLIRSTGNQLFITLITDGSVHNTGFAGGYRTSYGPAHGCGGVIRQSSGTITSLDADNNGQYEDNLDCEWTIFADENIVATLTFNSMDVEVSTNCVLDYVTVFDGPSRTGTVLGKFCGNTVPPSITASSNVIVVLFHTDGSLQGAGFSATFGQVDRVCGGSFNATTTPAVISSPNYPNPYSSGVMCSWVIDSGSSYDNVKVQITDLQMLDGANCSTDYLAIRDTTAPLVGREAHYCGSVIQQPFYSHGQRVAITYNLAGNSNTRGFQLKYSIAGCNRNYTGRGGQMSSPNYPNNYPHDLDCRINVTTPANTSLALYFYDFQTETHSNCAFDFLQVNNGSGFEVAKVCGGTLPSPIFLPDNRATIRFRTDHSLSRHGFMITYVASTQASGCGGEINDVERGSFTSPNYPSNSDRAMTCSWIIRPPRRIQLRVYFAFLSMADPSYCSSNYVALYDGTTTSGPLHGRYCAEGLPLANAIVISRPMLVTYVNTGTGAAPIFHIKFQS